MRTTRIVTNNSRVEEYVKQDRRAFRLDAIEGDVRDVVFCARDLLLEGWSLTADPLGGRRERANPFLTVILEKSPQASHWGLVGSGGLSGQSGEILRVEQLLALFERNEERLAALTQRQRSDYAAIDASLAIGVLDKL